MSNNFSFNWQSQRLKQHVHDATVTALVQTEADANGWFRLIVPIDTGELSKTFWSYVTDTHGYWVTLVFGMGGQGTRAAVYVELGTKYMLPRAPLRTTAMEVFPMIPYHLKEALGNHNQAQ